MDIKSKEARSENMAKIRSKNTKPELFIRSALFRKNHRFRVNYKTITGHPDIYFTKLRVAVFIHGCYWHRHKGCKYAYTPKTNTDFWLAKFETNQTRDEFVFSQLFQSNVRILIIWECTVKKMQRDILFCDETIAKIENFIITGNTKLLEI